MAENNNPKINLYRNIAITFAIFTILLLVTVFAFSYNQASIVISASNETVDLSFNASVKENPTNQELVDQDIVSGYMMIENLSASSTFEVLSTKTIQRSDGIVGRVRIINQGTKDQPLLETTQLESDNGVVVRTNKYVVVPAGGEVLVEVFPKDPELFEDIESGRLTIIKLNPGLQNVVYGLVDEVLTDRPMEKPVLAESDILRAKEVLQNQLLRSMTDTFGTDKFDFKVTETKSEYDIGDQVDQFRLSMSAIGKRLVVNHDQLASLIDRKIDQLELDLEADDFVSENFSYSVIEELDDSIIIKANYQVPVFITTDHPSLQSSQFSGLTKQAAAEYLDSLDMIDGYQILISPYWHDKLPQNSSKIKIVIK